MQILSNIWRRNNICLVLSLIFSANIDIACDSHSLHLIHCGDYILVQGITEDNLFWLEILFLVVSSCST